ARPQTRSPPRVPKASRLDGSGGGGGGESSPPPWVACRWPGKNARWFEARRDAGRHTSDLDDRLLTRRLGRWPSSRGEASERSGRIRKSEPGQLAPVQLDWEHARTPPTAPPLPELSRSA